MKLSGIKLSMLFHKSTFLNLNSSQIYLNLTVQYVKQGEKGCVCNSLYTLQYMNQVIKSKWRNTALFLTLLSLFSSRSTSFLTLLRAC